MKIITFIITVLVSISVFMGCNENDSFSTDSNLRLTFSTDTLRFDTVFTTIGTATKKLKVYNRNKSALLINSIELMSPSTSGFRMNVDGESGNNISNVSILGKDSIFIFVEATINPLNRDNPLLIADSIRFQFNGVTQYIRLEAIGQDVIFWKDKKITKDTILTDKKPFLIYDSLTIDKNVTLTVNENVYLYFHNNAKLKVEGTLNAKGTIAKPIVIRGDRTDNFLETPRIPYDRVPGQWFGIEIASSSFDNQLENVRIRNGIYGVYCHPSDTLKTKITILNTVIQNTTREGFLADNCKVIGKNSLFANSGNVTLMLNSGSASFLHCTIANYINTRYWNLIKRKALYIGNTDSSNGNFRFINSIVAGSSNSEIEIGEINPSSLKYIFINCLIKSNGSDDANFINTIWNIDPGFKYIYSAETALNNPDLYFLYNFELGENSAAIGKGFLQYSQELPFDILGNSRLNGNAPDIGCYQWIIRN